MDFLALCEENGTGLVELCYGRTRGGREFHAFIQMSVAQFRAYHRQLNEGARINLNECGTILHTGWGKTPDEETSLRILRDHTDNLKIAGVVAEHQLAMNMIIMKNSVEGARDDQ